MEKVLIINKYKKIEDLYDIDRIYIGNDFCEYALNETMTISLFKYYGDEIKTTLLLPFLTDFGLNKLKRILKTLSLMKLKNFEIVFNDWGTFYYLTEKYPTIKLVLGRLLTKQKKDPRIDKILKNEQESFKLLKIDNKTNIVHTKKVPNTLSELFNINLLQSKELICFLTSNNVYRIELDNLIWKNETALTKKIKVSLYYPYILLTLTRYCGAINSEFNSICNKNCNKKSKLLRDNFFIKGNALYYKNEIIPKISNLNNSNIDRIIYQKL